MKIAKSINSNVSYTGVFNNAFGMQLQNRHESVTDFRYGYNGMEMDEEVKNSSGTSYDFGSRIYDPRIGRWLSSDPKEAKYTPISPYSFAGNSPVQYMDPNGEEVIVTVTKDKDGVYNITLQAKIYLTGSGVSEEFICELNERVNTDRVFYDYTGCFDIVDDQGNLVESKSAIIKFDVEYIDASQDNNMKATNGTPETIVYMNTFDDEKFLKVNKGVLLGKSEKDGGLTGTGNNLVRIFDDEIFRSSARTESNYALVSNGKAQLNSEGKAVSTTTYDMNEKIWVMLHEVGHLLGLADKYVEVVESGMKESKAMPGFEGDFMAEVNPESIQFFVQHYDNIAKYWIQKFDSAKKGNKLTNNNELVEPSKVKL